MNCNIDYISVKPLSRRPEYPTSSIIRFILRWGFVQEECLLRVLALTSLTLNAYTSTNFSFFLSQL